VSGRGDHARDICQRARVGALPGTPAPDQLVSTAEKAKLARREEDSAAVVNAKKESEEAKRRLELINKPTVDAQPQGSAAPAKPTKARETKRGKPPPAGSSTDAAAAAAELAKSRGEAETKVTEAASKLNLAKKKNATFIASAAATQEMATNTTLLREARARMLWFGTFGLSLVVALGTIFAMGWAWITALDDHLRPIDRIWPTWPGELLSALGKLFLVVVVSLIAPVVICWVAYGITRILIFGGFPLPCPFALGELWTFAKGLLTFDDSFQSFIFGSDRKNLVQAGVLFPNGLWLVKALNIAVILAGIAIAAAVTATLYQHPAQVESRRPRRQNPATLTTANGYTYLQSLTYVPFLARCFRRLSVAIYFGAVLLVVCVAHINAQYSWPAALLEPGTTDELTKTDLPKAFTALADQASFEYGIIFTLVLIGLFLPTWVVLRRRAWEVARARKPDKTQGDQQKWLESEGLGFTSIQRVAQFLALLAPAGAGVFIDFVKAFSGG
jgi:hypothetical protein